MKGFNFSEIQNRVGRFFQQLSLYAAILLVGGAAVAFYIESQPVENKIDFFKAGEVSVSINEKSELTFINRKTGQTTLVDSTLTDIINNKLASEEYVKVNTTIR